MVRSADRVWMSRPSLVDSRGGQRRQPDLSWRPPRCVCRAAAGTRGSPRGTRGRPVPHSWTAVPHSWQACPALADSLSTLVASLSTRVASLSHTRGKPVHTRGKPVPHSWTACPHSWIACPALADSLSTLVASLSRTRGQPVHTRGNPVPHSWTACPHSWGAGVSAARSGCNTTGCRAATTTDATLAPRCVQVICSPDSAFRHKTTLRPRHANGFRLEGPRRPEPAGEAEVPDRQVHAAFTSIVNLRPAARS